MNWRTFLMFIWTLVWSVIGGVCMVLDPRGKLYSYLARTGWSRQTLWIGGIRVNMKASADIDWTRPYIICSNHQSQLDIPILFANLPTGIRFLAKRSLFYIPVFGWSLYVAGYIPIDRGRGAKARRSIKRAAEKIKKGPSLLVFPEGTRTPTGELLPFKSGAFIMAVQSSVPILPVTINGTYKITSKDRLDAHPGSVDLIVGAPIESAGLAMKDKEALKKRVRDAIGEMLSTGQPTAASISVELKKAVQS